MHIYIYIWIVYIYTILYIWIVYIYIYNILHMICYYIYILYMYNAYTYILWIYIYLYTYTYCGGRMCKIFTLLLLRSSLFGSGENGVGERLMVDGVGCFWVECQFLPVYWFQELWTLNASFWLWKVTVKKGIRHTVSICFRCFSSINIFYFRCGSLHVPRGWPLKLKFEKKSLVSGLLMGKCRCQGRAGQTWQGGFPDVRKPVLASTAGLCRCFSLSNSIYT